MKYNFATFIFLLMIAVTPFATAAYLHRDCPWLFAAAAVGLFAAYGVHRVVNE
jgi:hypothetical protein